MKIAGFPRRISARRVRPLAPNLGSSNPGARDPTGNRSLSALTGDRGALAGVESLANAERASWEPGRTKTARCKYGKASWNLRRADRTAPKFSLDSKSFGIDA